MQKAKIHEIFTSIQGEGIFTGKRQLFIRFYGCNANCAFCDTPQDTRDTKDYSVDELLEQVKRCHPGDIHSVSLTGGEPLLQVGFLIKFLPILKQCGYRVFLETNGTLPQQLKEVVDYVDIVAMDIKLPSSTKQHGFWFTHSQFLDHAIKRKVFVKAVITEDTSCEDIRIAVNLVEKKSPYITFILQPVTPQNGVGAADPKVLDNFKKIAESRLFNVKIIPQMHRMLGVK